MSKFVNYKKRSISLPPGCKNLFDLLQPHRKPKAHSIIFPDKQTTAKRGELGTAKLSEIEKYVAMPFQSHAQMILLMLSLLDKRLKVNFTQMQGELMSAAAVFEEDAHRERLIREFFVSHGLQLPRDDETPAQFAQFFPEEPVQLIYRISPLPSDVMSASNLTAELFRHVCGLSDDAQLTFRYCEFANAA